MISSKMRKLLYTVLLNIFLIQILSAQSSFLAKNLGDSVNTAVAELNPVVSPDGKTLYFSRVNHPLNKYGLKGSQDVWFAKKKANGSWGNVERCGDEINRGRYNALYAISEDGESAIINGEYSNGSVPVWLERGFSVVSKKTDGSWGAAKKIKVRGSLKKSKGAYLTAFFSYDGNHLLLSYSSSFDSKKGDIYVSHKSSKGWSKPKKLKKPVNTAKTEFAPSLSPDNNILYFSRLGKGKKASTDIYSCERRDDSFRKWSEPKKLSDTVNSQMFDGYFKTNAKGSWAFWASSNNTLGETDIYTVKLFEDNPNVLVKLHVLNKKTHKPYDLKYPLGLKLGGTLLDTVQYNRDSGFVMLTLPLGKNYQIDLDAKKILPAGIAIKTEGKREFYLLDTTVYYSPDTLVMVYGKLALKGAPKKLSGVKGIWVNGKEHTKAFIDTTTNSYSIEVPGGKKYAVELKAKGYVSHVDTLNLTKVILADSVKKDLFVSSVPFVLVKGKILNKKTNQVIALTRKVRFHLFVNDEILKGAEVDTINSTYQLVLQYGKSYAVSAEADSYFTQSENYDLTTAVKKDSVINRDLLLAPIEVGAVVKLSNIFFETGKATLKPASFPELDRVVTLLTENPTVKIEIDGHTDNVGKKETNMKLSASRAKSVENYLEKKGINTDRVTSKGYGDTKPVTSNATKAGKAQNRRVEFVIKGK